ncbi:MAG TPA: hypothetical protein VGK23_00415 [Methanomassiliicoccales archaeon]
MRLKRQYIAWVVVVMLIVTALLASMMSQYAQGGRIAYVSVKTDKTTYSEGENISFKFIPLTDGVYFSTSGIDYINSMFNGQKLGSVHIVRIPDSIDPDQIIRDRNMLNKIQSWDNRDMTVSFDYFNSTDGTKSLEWNATVMRSAFTYVGNFQMSHYAYTKAMAGYYLIYPQFTSLEGHSVKFQLDKNAIFYLDTLKMSSVPGLNESMISYNMTLSAPTSMVGNSHCVMSWSINGVTDRDPNGTDLRRAEFDIAPGGNHSLVIEEATIIYGGYGMQSFRLSGWIDTAWCNFTFERMDYLIGGGWYDSPQDYSYYY